MQGFIYEFIDLKGEKFGLNYKIGDALLIYKLKRDKRHLHIDLRKNLDKVGIIIIYSGEDAKEVFERMKYERRNNIPSTQEKKERARLKRNKRQKKFRAKHKPKKRECVCGSTVLNVSQHRQTNKHKEYMAKHPNIVEEEIS